MMAPVQSIMGVPAVRAELTVQANAYANRTAYDGGLAANVTSPGQHLPAWVIKNANASQAIANANQAFVLGIMLSTLS